MPSAAFDAAAAAAFDLDADADADRVAEADLTAVLSLAPPGKPLDECDERSPVSLLHHRSCRSR
ncbi:MAG: hypothetical protein EA400_12540 [Chromatiaceae bacterium]|nr:MAG: hypothetical protein EA400_12540 [Chromatiaceae bacterium]